MVRRSASASAPASIGPDAARGDQPWAPAGRGTSRPPRSPRRAPGPPRATSSRASLASPKIRSGPSRRSSVMPSSPAVHALGAGAQLRAARRPRPRARASAGGPAPGRRSSGALLATSGRSSARTPSSTQPAAGRRDAARRPTRRSRPARARPPRSRRSCGKSAWTCRSATDANGSTASRSASRVDVQRAHARAPAVSSASRTCACLGGAAAGDRDALDRGERRVAEPQPAERAARRARAAGRRARARAAGGDGPSQCRVRRRRAPVPTARP